MHRDSRVGLEARADYWILPLERLFMPLRCLGDPGTMLLRGLGGTLIVALSD